MSEYFQHFPEIDSVEWSEYFFKEFLPNYKFFENLSKSDYNYVQYNDVRMYPAIVKLSSILESKFNFPPIEYFLIFYHEKENQPIHIDGINKLRYASLNLSISGFENTKMIFYKKNNPNASVSVSNANYFDIRDLTPVAEFNGSNEWILVNSGEPHQVIGIDTANPRITVCIRFVGNPTFDQLVKNAKS
jgi:hypothetical protein